MKTLKALLCFVALLSCATAARAEWSVLVPIAYPAPVAGAHGSRWVSELWFHNGSPNQVMDCRTGGIMCIPGIPAWHTARHPVYPSAFGALLLGPDDLLHPQMTFSSRLFETSRGAQPLGVEVPVVRSEEFFTKPVRFLAVEPRRGRASLRVYHTDPAALRNGGSVRVEFIKADSTDTRVLASTTLELQYSTARKDPGYIALHDIAAQFPAVATVEVYDVAVTPLKPGMQYYALVSLADEQTQQVLLITTKQTP